MNIMAVKNYKPLNNCKILTSFRKNYISYFEVIKNIYSFLPVVVIGGSVDVMYIEEVIALYNLKLL